MHHVRGGNALVQGASRGLGLHLTKQLCERDSTERVFATCRQPERAHELSQLQQSFPSKLSILQLDVSHEDSIESARSAVEASCNGVDILLQTSGILHDGDMRPETSLQRMRKQDIERAFAVNTIGPLLVLKHFKTLLEAAGEPTQAGTKPFPIAAALSARLGSIGDNNSGGWYSYRSSKAALNQMIRTASFELSRRRGKAIAVALHPGTNDTNLTKPFQRNVPEQQLQHASQGALNLLRVIDSLEFEHSGSFFDWKGERIQW